MQNLCKENDYFQDTSSISKIDPSRLTTEDLATDSYQNVLFSILRFRSQTGGYPRRVTVVTHEFKRTRFTECHFPALGLVPWTREDKTRGNIPITVIGINPPEEVTPLESLVRGEAGKGIGLWKKDLYGTGAELSSKRSQRGWLEADNGLFLHADLEEVVEQLVCWNSGEENDLFPRIEELPWYYGHAS